MRIAYEVMDVFTEQRFAGNPLAVVPDVRTLDGRGRVPGDRQRSGHWPARGWSATN